PQAAAVYATRTFVVSLLLGTVVTVLSGVMPAVRATRVAPIYAAKGGVLQRVRSRRATIVGAALLAAAVLLLGYAVTGNRLGSGSSLLALAAGALALISGAAGVASRLVSSLARVLGWPSRRFGGAAGALASAHAAGVTKASSIRADRGLIGKTQVNVDGVDPATIGGLYHFEWKDGSSDRTLQQLADGGAIVKQSFAKKNHIALGDRFVLLSPSGEPVSLQAVGFYQPPRIAEVLGGVVIDQQTFDTTFPRAQNGLTLLDGKPTKAGLEHVLAAFPDTKVQTQSSYVKAQTSFINSLLNLLYVLLALSVVISLFGMINTLVLSVYERTREIGMLRVVGMSRRQVRRMVRHESVVTALIGAGIGLPAGVILAAAVTHALSRFGVSFAVSVPSLVAFTVIAIGAGIFAAMAPARRASKLNVLSALQYE